MSDRAVDRAVDKIETAFPAVPETAEAMVARWASRDALYAAARMPMSAEMEANIRSARMREANMLPNVRERATLYARAKTWAAPTHPDYGSLRDWVN